MRCTADGREEGGWLGWLGWAGWVTAEAGLAGLAGLAARLAGWLAGLTDDVDG